MGKIYKYGRNDLDGRFKPGPEYTLRQQYPEEWNIWYGMIYRCNQTERFPRYSNIKVCQEWCQSFENFIKDMGPRPNKSYSIDRINTLGNYEPANCRWATQSQQNLNQSRNIIRQRFGPEEYDYWYNICEHYGISKGLFHNRVRDQKMTPQQAATTEKGRWKHI